MARVARTSAPLPLPSLDRLFAALGDESRLAIVRLLLDGRLRTAGDIAERVGLPMSTCSYHLTKLLNSGLTVCQAEGAHRLPVLRREEIDEQFPGLLELIADRGGPAGP
jgi:DNA-binding transcriptional ArsR family regulator